MRRFFVLLCTVFLLGICAVPAFAYGVDSDPDTPILYGYSPLRFADISDGVGSYSWPYNSSVYGSYQEPFEFSYNFHGNISFDGLPGSVTGEFRLPSAGGSVGDGNTYTVTLSHYQMQLVRMLELDSFVLQALNGVRVLSVDVSFFLVEPVLGASLTDFERESWQMGVYSANASFYPDSQGNLNIGTWVRSMLREHPQIVGYSTAMIENLSVSINFQRSDVDSPGFALTYTALEADPITFISDWARARQMFRDVEYINPDFDLLGWLFSSVDGFLDISIAPGLTFRGIFYAVIAIGILVAFLLIMG